MENISEKELLAAELYYAYKLFQKKEKLENAYNQTLANQNLKNEEFEKEIANYAEYNKSDYQIKAELNDLMNEEEDYPDKYHIFNILEKRKIQTDPKIAKAYNETEEFISNKKVIYGYKVCGFPVHKHEYVRKVAEKCIPNENDRTEFFRLSDSFLEMLDNTYGMYDAIKAHKLTIKNFNKTDYKKLKKLINQYGDSWLKTHKYLLDGKYRDSVRAKYFQLTNDIRDINYFELTFDEKIDILKDEEIGQKYQQKYQQILDKKSEITAIKNKQKEFNEIASQENKKNYAIVDEFLEYYRNISLNIIPPYYVQEKNAIPQLLFLFTNKRADNITDLINIYENEVWKAEMLNQVQSMNSNLVQLERNITNNLVQIINKLDSIDKSLNSIDNSINKTNDLISKNNDLMTENMELQAELNKLTLQKMDKLSSQLSEQQKQFIKMSKNISELNNKKYEIRDYTNNTVLRIE